MWNSGDALIAADVLSSDWVGHAHSEVVGPDGVRQAVETIRTAQPDLQFRIDAILGGGDPIAVVSAAHAADQGASEPPDLACPARPESDGPDVDASRLPDGTP
jgi:hypothetical protein